MLDPVQLLRELVRIPSPSCDETRLAEFIHTWSRSHGLNVNWAGKNIVISMGSGGGERLLLNSHLDTVAASADWTTDPYLPKEDNDRVTGLGANDAKGSVAAILCAAQSCRELKIKGEVVVALTVEEETGRGGRGLEALIKELGNIDAAVIGEPTNLDICIAQKGLLILDVETTGTARHAAHADRTTGKNAIVEAARAIAKLSEWRPALEHPVLGPVTVNVTTIEGGRSHNVIPDRCKFCVDIRTVPGFPTDDIVREIESMTGASVHIRSDRMKPFGTAIDARIVKMAIEANPKGNIIGSATMSDAVWTRHVPTIKVGPGDSIRSHTPGEYITAEELRNGVTFYEKLIRNYTSHPRESGDDRCFMFTEG